MKAKPGKERFSLSRWSRRKLEAAMQPVTPAPVAPAPGAPPAAAAVPELPPVESLSFESDFSVFLRPGVDGELKQAALKKLFRDPRFNVMDGLDTYIDDYTKPDPIPPDVLADLLQRGFGSTEAEPAPLATAKAPTDQALTEPHAPALAPIGGDSDPTNLASSSFGETAAMPSRSPPPEIESVRAQPDDAGADVSQAGASGKH